MSRILIAVALLASVAFAQEVLFTSETIKELVPEEISALIRAPVRSSSDFVRVRNTLIKTVQDWGKGWLSEMGLPQNPLSANNEEYPYFHWIPPYITRVLPNNQPVTWSSPCFKSTTARVSMNANGTATVTLQLDQGGILCGDFYLFASVDSIQIINFPAAQRGTRSFLWTVPKDQTDAEKYDLATKGIRVFRFLDDPTQTVLNLLSTAFLFVPELSPSIPDDVAKANLDFLAKYAKKTMAPRQRPSVTIDENLVQSGDFFGIMRLDGLDPTLAWAMGSTTGHTAVALRMDNLLYVTESTTDGAYWPTNGIQKTLWKDWIRQVKAADSNVVWAPLSAAQRAKFNVTAAIQAFKGYEGFDYGYYNMLWAWIDTIKDNYPCLPPTYQQCLMFEHIEVLFGVLDRIVPQFNDMFTKQAYNHRLGTQNLNIAQLWQEADRQGVTARALPTLVEQDSWDYQTTRYNKSAVGKSMVCCVYVCAIWKAGGLFKDIGNDIQCTEQTNWDDYAMKFYDPNPRPQVCVNADPNNKLCQLEGKYSLTLNDFATKTPYPKYGEKCPSLAPDYKKPEIC